MDTGQTKITLCYKTLNYNENRRVLSKFLHTIIDFLSPHGCTYHATSLICFCQFEINALCDYVCFVVNINGIDINGHMRGTPFVID